MGFSEDAAARLKEIYEADHSEEIGSKAWELLTPAKRKEVASYKKTDCVTFAREVLTGALEEAGDKKGLSGLEGTVAKHKAKGTKIAEYLVQTLGWVGVYVTPDMYHASGDRDEHAAVYRKMTKKCSYYGIPITYLVMNYSPTQRSSSFPQPGALRQVPTEEKLAGYSQFMAVDFGFGLSSGGDHTWLYSNGYVYEVRYKKWGRDGDLYRKTSLGLWGYTDNVIVVPPDGASRLEATSKVMHWLSLPSFDTCTPGNNSW